MVGDKEDIPNDSVALLESVLGVVGGSASVSDGGKFVLRSVEYEKEEADKVGSSDGVGAAGTLESFRSLVVERSVTVSSWRTLTLSSNFVIPLFLFLRLDSRDMTMEVWVSFMELRALECLVSNHHSLVLRRPLCL